MKNAPTFKKQAFTLLERTIAFVVIFIITVGVTIKYLRSYINNAINHIDFVKEKITALGKNKLQGFTVKLSVSGGISNQFVVK